MAHNHRNSGPFHYECRTVIRQERSLTLLSGYKDISSNKSNLAKLEHWIA